MAKRPAKKTTAKKSVARKGSKVNPRAAGMTGRFYCQGIGDCHLLTFPKADGGSFRILIDCGIHLSVSGGPRTIERIVDDIIDQTGEDKFIDVVVGTHEHWDHNSGFLTAAERFKKLTFGEVWLGWTENPRDAQAKRLDDYKGHALTTLQQVGARLKQVVPSVGDPKQRDYFNGLAAGVDNILGFNFGIKGEKSRAARDAIVALAPDNVRYLEPGGAPIVRDGLPNVRIYVLGPPRDEDLLGIRESEDEMYGVGAGGWPAAHALASGLGASLGDPEGGVFSTPFEPDLGAAFTETVAAAERSARPGEPGEVTFLREHYTHKDWQRIDNEWLALSADLAMQIDNRTNNTSLVLAFEFVDTGRVLLFAADAQVGNWLSWQGVKWKVGNEIVRGPDLLARTVFYKVGHHGSHNATLKEKGLELMTDHDLSAFIPTNKTDAKNVGWGQMPFSPLLEELQTRTSHRVVRADDDWVTKGGAVPFPLPSGSLRRVTRAADGLWVQMDIA